MVAIGPILITIATVTAALGHRIRPRSYEVKERHSIPPQWKRLRPAPAETMLELRIALKQSRFDELERHLYEVSNPEHHRYGQHLSGDDVNELIKPTQETSALVHEWLSANGYGPEKLGYSPAQDWLRLSLPVAEAEELLDTQYFVFRHEDGSELIRTPAWSLPAHLHRHIDAIQPTNSFFHMTPQRATWMYAPDQASAPSSSSSAQDPNSPNAQSLASASNSAVMQVCNASRVTPDCLRTIYGTKDYVPKVPARSKIGYCNYLEETTILTDLSAYVNTYRQDAQGATIRFDLVNNGENQQVLDRTKQAKGADTEGNLDGQTIVGITHPIPITAYNTGGSPPITGAYAPPPGQNNTNEPYLDWLQYILAQKNEDIPPTISTSYGEDEQSVPKDFATRVCQDMAQLGTRGVTLLFSSGDAGVGNPAVGNGVCKIFNNPDQPDNGTPNFLPAFPAGCPYVTAVGGTRGLGTSTSTISGNFSTEVAAGYPNGMSKYSSGGGFSNYFPRPDWQEAVVQAYIAKLQPGEVDTNMYNHSGRGYPDVAANGQGYAVFWSGGVISVDGTSASAPTMASVIALLNDDLLATGKPPLGFMNPWLYSIGKSGFTDITEGSSVGCNSKGFPAKEGWDAVTGFGTPNFPELQKLAQQAAPDPGVGGFIGQGSRPGRPPGGWTWGGRYFRV